jgi:hypothetical protein
MIRKVGPNTWRVLSEKKGKDGTHKNLGEADSLAAAKRRLQQVEFFKRKGKKGQP